MPYTRLTRARPESGPRSVRQPTDPVWQFAYFADMHKQRIVFLSGALALTLFSACAAVYASDGTATSGSPGISETRGGEAMSLASLQSRLRHTKALTIGGKLGLKLEIDNLVFKFRVAHDSGREVAFLRQPYDALLAKIRSSLVRDPQLSMDIAVSSEAIWGVLTDPTKFAPLG
jgi:hypothetical protein